jgi:hypothetical protein
VAELLYGSPAHRPLSSKELTEWAAVWAIRADEQEEANRRANRG